jgi:hypothetical protein
MVGLTIPDEKAAAQANRGERPVTRRRPRSRVIPFCPHCGSDNLRRSRRRWYERLIFRPRMLRCLDCLKRCPEPRKSSDA